jgi:hypothetical protein
LTNFWQNCLGKNGAGIISETKIKRHSIQVAVTKQQLTYYLKTLHQNA